MKLKYSFSIQPAGDSLMAVASGDDAAKFSGMLRMNDEGRAIMEALQEETDVDSIVRKLKTEYLGDEAHIRGQVESFVQKLSKAGLLV